MRHLVLPGLAAIAIAAPAAAAPIALEHAALPQCLEQLSASTGARFIVSPALARRTPNCRAVASAETVPVALERALDASEVTWRLREDGVFLLAAADDGIDGRLETLKVDDAALPELAPAAGALPGTPRPAIADLASATRYDAHELEAKPLLRFNQLSRLAPNVYSSGQSLSIRGVPRDNDYFTASTVWLDGIDIGTLLLEHNLVALDELVALEYRRGASAFELGSGAGAGAVLLSTAAPSPEAGARVSVDAGQRNAWSLAGSATGALGDSGASARVALARRDEPRYVRSLVVPELDGTIDQRQDASAKLLFEPETLPGFTLAANAFRIEGDAPDRSVARFAGRPFDIYGGESADTTARDWDLAATGLGLRAERAFARGQGAVWLSDLSASRTAQVRDIAREPGMQQDIEDRTRAGAALSLALATAWKLHLAAEHAAIESVERHVVSTIPALPATAPSLVVDRTLLDLDSRSLAAELAYQQGAWRAMLGLRRVDESVDYLDRSVIEDGAGGRRVLTRTDTSTDYARTLPSAGIEFRHGNDRVGASAGRGYRSGGRIDLPGIGAFGPETLDTLELFWHRHWLDGVLATRLGVFRTDWRDRTSIDGAEFEFDAALGEQWSLRGGIGWLDAVHDGGAYRLPLAGRPPLPDTVLEGLRAADAPRTTAVLGAIWRGEGGWSAALDAYHAGRAGSSNLLADPRIVTLPRREAYTVIDARLAWQHGAFEVALTASNLFDEKYIDRFVNGQPFSRLIGEPRQIDLQFTYTF